MAERRTSGGNSSRYGERKSGGSRYDSEAREYYEDSSTRNNTRDSTRNASRTRRKSPKEGNTFFGGMAILTVGIVVVKLIGMFYKIPLGNIIGDQGNADFQNAYNIYAVLLTISTAGLPVAVSKLISEANTLGNESEVQRIFQVSLKFFFIMGGISFCIMFFFSNQLAFFMGDSLAAPSIRALAPAVVFISGVSAFRGYFQGKGFMTPTAVSQIIEALCKLLLGLFLAKFIMDMDFTTEHLDKYRKDLDYTAMNSVELEAALESTQASQAASGAIIGVTVGTALAFVFLLLYFFLNEGKRRRKREETVSSEGSIIGKLLAIAVPITLTSSMASILNLLDAALVQWQLQSSLQMTENESRIQYGNYSWALTIYNLPLSLISAVTISVIPAVSAALAERNRKKGAKFAISALRMTALVGMPMGFGLFALGEPIIALLYPAADLKLAGTLLSTFGIASCFVCLSLVSTAILQSYGFVYLPILISVTGGIIKVISNFILVGTPSIGIYGAPIGHLLCFSFCFAASFSALLKIVYGLKKSISMFFKPLFASIVMAGAAYVTESGLSRFLQDNLRFMAESGEGLSGTGRALCVFPSILVAGVIYLALILLLGGLERSDVLMMPKGEKIARLLRL